MNMALVPASPAAMVGRFGDRGDRGHESRRKEMSMNKSMFVALALAAMGASAAHAATSQEQAACRSDARKYCSSHVGKPQEMLSCLADHKADLSEACRKVVESHGG